MGIPANLGTDQEGLASLSPRRAKPVRPARGDQGVLGNSDRREDRRRSPDQEDGQRLLVFS